MLTQPAASGTPADERVSHALILLLLASRTAVVVYAVCVEAINLAAYQRPALAMAAAAVAMIASAAGGILAWHRQAVPAPGVVADALAAVLVLLALSLAIRPAERMGSLNWALTYAVSCASWLALGAVRWWRALLACLLGVIYGVSVVRHGDATATTVIAVVNALSPPLYFAIAAAVFRVMYRIAQEIDRGQETEWRELGEAAHLRERERLFREMHQPVLAVLDTIASAGASQAQLRARAYAEAAALRHAFSDPAQVSASSLRARLMSLAEDHACTGWVIRVIDEEMTAEPPAAITRVLCNVVAELLGETIATPVPGHTVPGHTVPGQAVPGQIRIRVQCDGTGTSIVLRISGCEGMAESAISQARACLAMASGTVSLAPALSGERRVLLWAPP